MLSRSEQDAYNVKIAGFKPTGGTYSRDIGFRARKGVEYG